MKKTPLDRLQSDIDKLLQDYAEDTTKTVDDLAKDFGKKGAKALRSSSQDLFKGRKYARGWTVTVEKTRYGTTAVIHNKTPGLPHLLENGHAKRGGGRVAGRPHIAPVEKEIVKEFRRAVENDI